VAGVHMVAPDQVSQPSGITAIPVTQPFLGWALSDREADLARRRDLDRGSGRRIASLAGWTVLHLEFAETRNRDFFTLGSGFADRRKDPLDGLLGFGFGEAGGARQLIGHIR